MSRRNIILSKRLLVIHLQVSNIPKINILYFSDLYCTEKSIELIFFLTKGIIPTNK